MLADGFPAFLFLTTEQRAQNWKDRPPKAMPADKGGYSRYRDPETERLARLYEIDKENPSPAVKSPPVKKAKPLKDAFGTGFYITEIKNTRKEGTGAHTRVAALMAYLKKNKGKEVTVEEALRETPYRKDDYQWDFSRGHLKVAKQKGKK